MPNRHVLFKKAHTRGIVLTAISSLVLFAPPASSEEANLTKRIPQFSNDRVIVWETTIYPSAKHPLAMHRHDQDRVLVSFDDGTLKITNDKGQVHYLTLEKNKSYYLAKDVPGEVHMDENTTDHPLKVLVITLKDMP